MARMRNFFGGPGGDQIRPGAIAAVAAIAFALWALSGLYLVQPNEQAVITTFGSYSRSAGPGLNYRLPSPIERVEKVPVTSLNRIDIGGTSEAANPQESLMLTGDENIIDLKFSVTWRVADAPRFIFTIRDPEESVKAVAESAMREVVGRSALDYILTRGRGPVQAQAAELMQQTLDSWGAGVSVVEVQIRNADPPSEVIAAFRDVFNASQDAESARNESEAYFNRVVNEAKGDAARITQAGEAYREQAVREATGEASRFDQIYAEYRSAPAVTRERLYIETMQRVLQNSNKVIVDSDGATAPIILPPDVFRPRTGPSASSATPAETGSAAPGARSSQ
ncbi:FtsH protease activity modulator HflK [Phenylobacterium sp.]|uniref:FtsH protease activity modulator HflK n=1 Tax=Phenylobacterium sp. TaxID=1871053 RepID=UPI002731AD81|nr:FtsH protease activity modulator HflK [Phenylobacterium sp.]MDP1616980.1 FtsH protease activity modulator HflK [Phenylobacterium sp.]MDP1986181.1 FtsH protease activity modulator HflK [Phenylobacterium sp.]